MRLAVQVLEGAPPAHNPKAEVQAAPGGPFLSQGQADMLFTPVRKDYGLGFELDHQGMQPVFHHSGANGGYQALMFGYVGSGQAAPWQTTLTV